MGCTESTSFRPPQYRAPHQRYQPRPVSTTPAPQQLLFAQPQPVAAVGVRYCSASPLTLHLKEKSWTISGDDFTIRNASTGQIQFRLDGASVSFSDRKTLFNTSNQSIAFMRKELLSVMPSFYVSSDRDSRHVLITIKAKLAFTTVLDCTFRNVATGKQCKLSVQGDWRARSAAIYLEQAGNNQTLQVARVYRPSATTRNMVLNKQDYYVDIAPNVDAALIALVCVAIDESKKD